MFAISVKSGPVQVEDALRYCNLLSQYFLQFRECLLTFQKGVWGHWIAKGIAIVGQVG